VNDPLRAQQIVRRQVRRRRRWRRLRVAALVVIASAAVVAAAFGIDRLAVVVHKFYAEHHHLHPQTTTLTTKTTTTTTLPGSPRCDSPQLSASVSDWRETAGSVEEMVTLTNISETPCSLTGYPSIGAVAQDGTPLPAPNAELASLGSSDVNGTATPSSAVTLAHGARASFELVFANTCDHVLEPGEPATGALNECYDGIWLDVTPPQGTTPLLVTQPVRLTYTTTGFEVGPFLAGDGPPLQGQPPLTSPTTSSTTP
jgi:hypothetical protein